METYAKVHCKVFEKYFILKNIKGTMWQIYKCINKTNEVLDKRHKIYLLQLFWKDYVSKRTKDISYIRIIMNFFCFDEGVAG